MLGKTTATTSNPVTIGQRGPDPVASNRGWSNDNSAAEAYTSNQVQMSGLVQTKPTTVGNNADTMSAVIMQEGTGNRFPSRPMLPYYSPNNSANLPTYSYIQPGDRSKEAQPNPAPNVSVVFPASPMDPPSGHKTTSHGMHPQLAHTNHRLSHLNQPPVT